MALLATLGDLGTLTPLTWPEAEQKTIPGAGFSKLAF